MIFSIKHANFYHTTSPTFLMARVPPGMENLEKVGNLILDSMP